MHQAFWQSLELRGSFRVGSVGGGGGGGEGEGECPVSILSCPPTPPTEKKAKLKHTNIGIRWARGGDMLWWWWGGVVAVSLLRQRIGDTLKGMHHVCQARLYLLPGMNGKMLRIWQRPRV